MPDRRRHRGLHPEDSECFGAAALPQLRAAARDVSWLYERGYKPVSSLKLVGDRYGLVERQRAAVSRCACAPTIVERRVAHRVEPAAVRGEALWIDGFNVLTSLEVALSGGVVLIGRDGCARDIAGVHGSYRTVEETVPAIELLAATIAELGVLRCEWLLDKPVSNSGRLRATLESHARAANLEWTIELVANPDPLLAASPHIVATADGEVLDAAARSLNLVRLCIERAIPSAFIVDLSSDA